MKKTFKVNFRRDASYASHASCTSRLISLIVSTAFVCALHGAMTVHKAPLKGLLIDNAAVVTNVTGTEAATRLESPDGSIWQDADGNLYQFQRRARFNGMEAVREGIPRDGTSQWMFFEIPDGGGYCSLQYDPPGNRWSLVLNRMEDVENADGEISQDRVNHTWEASAPWEVETLTLKGQSGTATVTLSFETNIIDRVAYTSDVARLTISGGITTNDVCKIVTNEVVEWVCDPSEMYGRKISVVWYDSELSAGWYPAFDGEMYFNSDPRIGDGDTFRWIANRNWDQPFDLVATRKKSNALGLARLSDLSDYVTTNDVRNIVTNKTEYSQWKLSVDIPENALIPSDVIQFLSARLGNVGVEFGEDKSPDDDYYRAYWCLINLPDIEGWWSPPTDYDVKDRSDTNLVWQAYVNDMDNKIIRIRGTRELQNTLGLAMLKDIEKLPDHETVTNVARSVVNSVWDASLGVAWEARMHNGHLYYIAVTNRLPEVK